MVDEAHLLDHPQAHQTDDLPMNTWTAKAHELRAEQARVFTNIIRDINPEQLERVYSTTLAGDERKLRGIPCKARGVGGAIPGTNPSSAIR